jgi:hypothetical protein
MIQRCYSATSGGNAVVRASSRADELVCQPATLAGQAPGSIGIEKFGEVG